LTLNAWLFLILDEVRFLFGSGALSSPDQIWRTAHRYDLWSKFSELGLRLLSGPASESDAERIFSRKRALRCSMDVDSGSLALKQE
jgi:hypothetical protein